MSTAVLPVSSAPEQRLLLYNIDWSTYDRLLHDLEGHHLRLNYDRGRLEIMTTSSDHERWKKLLARFFEILTMELDVPIMGVGNFTCRREDLDRGLEPDECWYIAHEAVVRDRRQIDLDVDLLPISSSKLRSAGASSTDWGFSPRSACRRSVATTEAGSR